MCNITEVLADNEQIEAPVLGSNYTAVPNTSVNLNCKDSGHELRGSFIITCMENGHWNPPPSEINFCHGIHLIFLIQ